MFKRRMGESANMSDRSTANDAVLAVIYAWYISMRLRGLSKDDAISAMRESWEAAAIASKKNYDFVHNRAEHIFVELKEIIDKYKKDTCNEIKGPSNLSRLFTQEYETEWPEGEETL